MHARADIRRRERQLSAWSRAASTRHGDDFRQLISQRCSRRRLGPCSTAVVASCPPPTRPVAPVCLHRTSDVNKATSVNANAKATTLKAKAKLDQGQDPQSQSHSNMLPQHCQCRQRTTDESTFTKIIKYSQPI